jgi:hypothetical protein
LFGQDQCVHRFARMPGFLESVRGDQPLRHQDSR